MKIDCKKMFTAYSNWFKAHQSEVITGVGLTGMGVTMWTVHKLSPKLKEKLDENPDMTKWEKVKTVASVYWPSALAFGSSTALILWSHKIQSRKIVAATSATIFAQRELQRFQEAAVEKIGSDTVKEIKEKVAEKKAEATPAPSEQQVLTMGYMNKQLYIDEISGRRFFSNDNILFNAQNELNSKMLRGLDSISVNQWWSEIGLDPTSIGDEIGWSTMHGAGQLIDIDTSYRGTDKETGMKYILLAYNNPPRFDYEG